MKGIYSALINTFNSDGSVNIEALKRVIDYNIEVCKIDGLYVNGSTGESFNMPHCDKIKSLRETAKYVNGRVNLIAQIGCNVVEEIYELADIAYECGYDAISAVTPYYFVYTKDEIVAHYNKIAEYSKLPLIIYNIPVRTSVVLTRSDFQKLLSHENIKGVKFTSNDFYLLDNIREDFPNALIYSGYDEMLLSAAVLNTDGAIGSTYNIIGHWAKDVMNAVKNNDLDFARKRQRNINTVVGKLLYGENLLSTLKAVFNVCGLDCGECRLPMSPISERHIKIAEDIVEYIKLNNSTNS